MSKEIDGRVLELVARQLGVNIKAVAPEHSLEDDLGADSLDLIEMVMDAEVEFDIDIRDEDAESVDTVQDAIDLVGRLISA